MNKLAVFVSGTGSILEAMIEYGLKIDLVVADRACRGLEIAESAGLAAVCVDRKDFKSDKGFDREAHTLAITESLKDHDITHVAMAGFMSILVKPVFDLVGEHILNTHPALLPSFIGDDAVGDSFAYGVQVTGFTIHVATPELDAGPIVLQVPVMVRPGDTKDSLHERIKIQERHHYPRFVEAWVQGKTYRPEFVIEERS